MRKSRKHTAVVNDGWELKAERFAKRRGRLKKDIVTGKCGEDDFFLKGPSGGGLAGCVRKL
jgi:hypothetical protein